MNAGPILALSHLRSRRLWPIAAKRNYDDILQLAKADVAFCVTALSYRPRPPA
jgi:hypothetical protein